VRALIAAARAARPDARIVCSLRDVARQTQVDERFDPAPSHRRQIVEGLGAFDALFVHVDPAFTRIEEHLPWASELTTPIAYTGFVSEKRVAGAARAPGTRRAVVASAGGSDTGTEFLSAVIAAWGILERAGRIGDRALVAFCPLRSSDADISALRRLALDSSVRVEPFSCDFLPWLAEADLSISRAGYNTCANLLETRRRALLIPDPAMSDQPFRARRFDERGLAEVLDDPGPERCAEAILRALARPEPDHDFALDGAERTRALVEAL
jgi:predicted glycosyltransferase